MSRASGFIKSTGIYLVGNVLTKLLSFFLLPLYTAVLAPDVFGLYNLGVSILSLLVPFFTLEIWTGVLRFMLEKADSERKMEVSAAGLTICGCSIVLFTVLLIFAQLIAPNTIYYYVYILGVTQALHYTYLSFARGYGKNLLYAVSGILCTFLTLIINVVLILVYHMGAEALYIAAILGLWSQIIAIECNVKVLFRMKRSYFRRPVIREIAVFSVPLSLNTICYFFASSYNSIAISMQIGLSETGVYSVAGKFVTVISLFSSCITLAMQEMLYRADDEKNKSHFYTQTLNYYFKFITFAMLLCLPVIKVLFPYFVNEAYSSSLSLIPLYLLATVASNYSSFIGNYFIAERITAGLTGSLFIAGIINFILITLLLPIVGVQSSAISLLIGFAVAIMIRVLLLRKTVFIRFSVKYLLQFICLFAVGTYMFLTCGILLNSLYFFVVLCYAMFVFQDVVRSVLQNIKARIASHRTIKQR